MQNNLNPAQHQAVTSSSKKIVLLAGAGTGKTHTLTSRISYLFDEKRVGTSNMLALTFTRLAGHEMKERIAKLIGEHHAKNLFCNTFHAFCVEVLKQWGHLVDLEPNFTIYDPADQEAIIRAVIDECRYKTKPDHVLHDIRYLQGLEECPVSRDSEEAAKEYFYRLKRNNAISLDELLTRTLQLFQQEQVAAYYREHYKYVFVDEYQDTDFIQKEIIDKLAPEHLFFVGDDFQSIYRFRGARVDNILEVAVDPSFEVIKLEENYRSTAPIVTAANVLIKHNTKQTEKILNNDRDGESIVVQTVACEFDEVQPVIAEANAVRERGGKLSDIAVLVRTNRQLDMFKNRLKQEEVPAVIVSKSADPLKKPDIEKLTRFIEFVINPADERALRSVINFPKRLVTELELAKLAVEMDSTGASLEETLAQKGKHDVRQFIASIRELRNPTAEDVFDFWGSTAYESFRQAAYQMGLKRYYEENSLSNRIEDMIEALKVVKRWCQQQEAAGEANGIVAFMKWLRIRDLQDYFRKDVDAVQLMTVHGSKGLEFDTVILAGMNEDTFPSRRAKDPEEAEEERRLAYVAVTRAKRRLVLTRPQEVLAYGNKVQTPAPSRYIAEMGLMA